MIGVCEVIFVFPNVKISFLTKLIRPVQKCDKTLRAGVTERIIKSIKNHVNVARTTHRTNGGATPVSKGSLTVPNDEAFTVQIPITILKSSLKFALTHSIAHFKVS